MTRSAWAGLAGASAARPSKYVATLLRSGTPYLRSSLLLPVALAGSLTCSATFRKSVQNFPQSAALPVGAAAGDEVLLPAGMLTPPDAEVPAPPELVELPLQPASARHAPATTL